MTNYATMAKRIRKAKTLEDLNKYETSLDNLYKNGILTIAEFSSLDSLIVDCKIQLEI